MYRPLISLRLALRNLRRNKRRTLLTSTGLAIGLMTLVIAFGVLDGFLEQSLDSFIDFEVAHLKMFPDGMLDEDMPGLEYRIDGSAAIAEELRTEKGVVGVTERLVIQGQLISGSEEAFVSIVGADRVNDHKVYSTLGQVSNGEVFSDSVEGVLVGRILARDMGIKRGDRVTLLLRSAPGAFNSRTLPVSGILRTANPNVDGHHIYIPLTLARQLALLEDGATEIALRFDHRDQANERVTALQKQFPGYDWQTWNEGTSDFMATYRFRQIVFSVIIGILALIATVAVTNTMMMAVHERTLEIGALRAMGFQGSMVGQIFLFEGLLIGLIAGSIAVVCGGAIVLYLHRVGIPLDTFDGMDSGLPIQDALYPRLTATTVLANYLVAIFLTGVAAWRASRRARRGEVVRALREGML